MTVRILRVLEYEYPDIDTAVADVARWQVPAQGSAGKGSHTIRSAIVGGVTGYIPIEQLEPRRPQPLRLPRDLEPPVARDIIAHIQNLLWVTDTRQWDPDKQWSADLIEEVARVLADEGLRPE